MGFLILALLAILRRPAFGADEAVIWNFGGGTSPDGSPADAAYPKSNLVMDANGNLYGTSEAGGAYNLPRCVLCSGLGTVFSLTPPSTSGGSWNESVLWDFGNGTDGSNPVGGSSATVKATFTA